MQRREATGLEHDRAAREPDRRNSDHQRAYPDNQHRHHSPTVTAAVPTQTRPVRNDQFDELDIIVVHGASVLLAPQREQPHFLIPLLLHQILSDGGLSEPWSTRRA
jgi:hypothetical protein